MRFYFLKSAAAVLLVCVLMFSLAGCEKMDYGQAIDLYNTGKFDEAAEKFAALGGYADSAQMQTLSQYWAAITLMEAEDYEKALPRFRKLGNYEDAPQRVTECIYRIAIAEFDAGNYSDAEAHFEDVADYKQAPEYLRQLSWQKLFDAVAAAGEEGISTDTSEGMTLQILAVKGAPDQLTFFVSHEVQTDYAYYDDLTLTLARDSLIAEFTATGSFSMDYLGNEIGSRQIASGKVDISALTADTVLKVDRFQITGTDNLGNPIASEDPADMLMAGDMAESLRNLLAVMPALLNSADIPLTLQDIGFAP